MSRKAPVPEPRSITTYLEDGAQIAVIFLVWGALAAVFRYGISDLGLPFERVWLQLGALFWYVGLFNAVLYVLYRTVDYWHASA